MSTYNWKTSPKFKWDTFPTYFIDLRDLADPRDICRIFSTYKIDKYVYCIENLELNTQEDRVIKYGMSAAESDTREWGDRLYRQIAHCSSWGSRRIGGSSGADWRSIEDEFFKKHGKELNHMAMTVTIWDVSRYEFQSFYPIDEVKEMETEKIMEHIRVHAKPPIGNVKERAGRRGLKGTKSFVSVGLFKDLFSEDTE